LAIKHISMERLDMPLHARARAHMCVGVCACVRACACVHIWGLGRGLLSQGFFFFFFFFAILQFQLASTCWRCCRSADLLDEGNLRVIRWLRVNTLSPEVLATQGSPVWRLERHLCVLVDNGST
jgi:hypothetical protein